MGKEWAVLLWTLDYLYVVNLRYRADMNPQSQAGLRVTAVAVVDTLASQGAINTVHLSFGLVKWC